MIDINLLPPQDVAKKEEALLRSKAIFGIVAVTILFAVVIGGTFFYEGYLVVQRNSLAARKEAATVTLTQLGQLASELITLHQKLSGINTVEASRFNFPASFKYVQGLYPAGVKVTKVTVNSDGKVAFAGESQSSGAVATLVSNLSSDQTLKQVKLASLTMNDDGGFSFSINAQYGPGSTKNTNN